MASIEMLTTSLQDFQRNGGVERDGMMAMNSTLKDHVSPIKDKSKIFAWKEISTPN